MLITTMKDGHFRTRGCQFKFTQRRANERENIYPALEMISTGAPDVCTRYARVYRPVMVLHYAFLILICLFKKSSFSLLDH